MESTKIINPPRRPFVDAILAALDKLTMGRHKRPFLGRTTRLSVVMCLGPEAVPVQVWTHDTGRIRRSVKKEGDSWTLVN